MPVLRRSLAQSCQPCFKNPGLRPLVRQPRTPCRLRTPAGRQFTTLRRTLRSRTPRRSERRTALCRLSPMRLRSRSRRSRAALPPRGRRSPDSTPPRHWRRPAAAPQTADRTYGTNTRTMASLPPTPSPHGIPGTGRDPARVDLIGGVDGSAAPAPPEQCSSRGHWPQRFGAPCARRRRCRLLVLFHRHPPARTLVAAVLGIGELLLRGLLLGGVAASRNLFSFATACPAPGRIRHRSRRHPEARQHERLQHPPDRDDCDKETEVTERNHVNAPRQAWPRVHPRWCAYQLLPAVPTCHT